MVVLAGSSWWSVIDEGPRLPPPNPINRAARNAKPQSDGTGTLDTLECADLPNGVRVQCRRQTASRNRLLKVLALGAGVEMRWLKAQGVVAAVRDNLVGRDFPVRKLVTHAMNKHRLAVKPDYPIAASVRRAGPQQASGYSVSHATGCKFLGRPRQLLDH